MAKAKKEWKKRMHIITSESLTLDLSYLLLNTFMKKRFNSI